METETTEVQTAPQNLLDARGENIRRWGRFCEISAALMFSVVVALVVYGIRSGSVLEVLAAIILLIVSVCLLYVASRCTYKVNAQLKRIRKKSRYLVSQYRINTLEQARAPTDVIRYLQSIAHPYHAVTQDDLLAKLRVALGSERTREVKDLVLKYTKVDEERHDLSEAKSRRHKAAKPRRRGRRLGYQGR